MSMFPDGAMGSSAASVIHDISYQHYEGQRLGRWYIVRSLFLDTLRGAYGFGRSGRSKVVPLLLLALACLPAFVAAIEVNLTGNEELPFGYWEYPAAISPLIVLFVAARAPASVARDLRFRLIPLYFSRPLRRSDYIRARYAALAAAVLILAVLPMLVMYAGALLATMPAWTQTRELLEAIAGAAALSLLLAGMALVIASITPRRGIGVTSIIVALVVLAAVQGSLQELGQSEGNDELFLYSRLLFPATLVQVLQAWVFRQRLGNEALLPTTAQGLLFSLAAIAIVVGTFLVLELRYRKVPVS